MSERLEHIANMGITAVELMPIHEFNELEYYSLNPVTGEHRFNFWGYSTVRKTLRERTSTPRARAAQWTEEKRTYVCVCVCVCVLCTGGVQCAHGEVRRRGGRRQRARRRARAQAARQRLPQQRSGGAPTSQPHLVPPHAPADAASGRAAGGRWWANRLRTPRGFSSARSRGSPPLNVVPS